MPASNGEWQLVQRASGIRKIGIFSEGSDGSNVNIEDAPLLEIEKAVFNTADSSPYSRKPIETLIYHKQAHFRVQDAVHFRPLGF